MSDDGSIQADGSDVEGDGGSPGLGRSWRGVWQLPAIVGSLGLIALAIVIASRRAPAEDWDGALDEVRDFIVAGELELARDRMQVTLEPNLLEASPIQQARFRALAADWISRSQADRGASLNENNVLIDEQYAMAVDAGLPLDAERIERWGDAQLALDRLDDVRDRIAELEALAASALGGPEAGVRRNRLLRQLVERSLQEEELPLDAMLAALNRYRDDALLSDRDRAWALAREVDLRIEAGQFRPAVDRLLLAMRRFETAGAQLDEDIWGGLYGRLARGYERLGLAEDAAFHLEEAFNRFENATPDRGRAELLRARLDIADGAYEEALPRLQRIIGEYAGTDVELPSRLAAAELQGILGQHDSALADYATLRDRLGQAPVTRDVTPIRIAASLSDRHDAQLAAGDLETALAYADAALSFFPRGDAPAEVLKRIAATNHSMAVGLLGAARAQIAARAAEGGAPIDPQSIGEDAIAPEIRARAQERLIAAADHYLRHARSIVAIPGQDEAWAASLWLAGDTLDRAGRVDQAIEVMSEYLASRPNGDPIRARVMYRLAEALESTGEGDAAIERYRQLIDEHPTSLEGTRAHPSLARVLVATGRSSEAEDVLLTVVDGRTPGGQAGESSPLSPDALDYRRALIDLGRLYLRTGREREAIERLDAALLRDPDAPDAHAVRHWLAESHRGLAARIDERLESAERMRPSERRSRSAARDAHLETSILLFDDVVSAWDRRDESTLDQRERAMLRGAHVGRARAAYDLGRWDLAARLYDRVARRFASEHIAMQALVQVVNCYERLGDPDRAEVAHRNALVRLARMPDAAFDDPASLMDRGAWEQWLRDRPAGRLAVAQPDPAN
ncbi:MAG: tetratricopeptide repeat protein [Phycisphaerales bacterium]